MTANKKLIVFIFGLCPIIPAASNFAYGLVLTVCLWIIFCLGFLGTYIFKLLEITHFKYIFVNLFMIAGAAMFNSLLGGLIPIIQG